MMRWVRDWETVHCISGSFFHLLNIANDNNRQECVEVILSMMPGAQRPACLFNNGEYLQSFKIFSPVNFVMRKKRGLVLTEQIIQFWLTKMKSLNINNYLATNVHEGFRKIFLANIRRQAGLLWVGSIIILTSLTFSEASPQLPFICKVSKTRMELSSSSVMLILWNSGEKSWLCPETKKRLLPELCGPGGGQ